MAMYSRSNHKNLRLVLSVALEHIQANLTQFTKDATGINYDRAMGVSTKSEHFQSSWKENSTRLSIWSVSAPLDEVGVSANASYCLVLDLAGVLLLGRVGLFASGL